MASLRSQSKWRVWIQLFLFALLLTAGIGFTLSSEQLLMRRVSIQEGHAAKEDITAPTRIEFESTILTDADRKRASADISDIYDPLDRQVGRKQVNVAQQVLAFIDSVRSDPYASPEYQQYCLESIEPVRLSAQVVSDTLQLSEVEWKVVQLETRKVLAQVMREEIKTGQEDRFRRSVRVLIDFELNEPQTAVVTEIAGALVKVNHAYNPEATEAARQAAMDSIPPRTRTLEQNEIIVRNGELVTPEDIEALAALNLLSPQVDWVSISGTFLFVLLLAVSISVYLWYGELHLVHRPHHLLLFLLLLVLFTLLAKWGMSQPFSQLYLAPLATLGMLVTVLFGVRLGLVAQVIICLVVGYMTEGQLDQFLYHLAGGLVGIFALRRVNQIKTFIWAGLYVMLSNVVVTVIFALLGGDVDTLRLGRLVLVGVVNGGFSAILTLGGYYSLGMMFGITTTLQLLDIARPTHTLMRELLLKAPGTYHHSIMVGNMAEQAAEAIGADALLARVGAFYHDIGKTLRPYFFTENQLEGSNPHDLLDPETSTQIIRSHTRDGLELARRYRLPAAIRAFIAEHHGTTKIAYFYHKASQEYGKEQVSEADYRHSGPRPQSKETAIVMMADGCEAAVRSVHPQDAEALERLIRRIISDKVSNGQLNDAPLTLKEIEIITSSFIDTLQGVFHPRVRYPDSEQRTASAAEEPASAQAAVGTGDDGVRTSEAKQEGAAFTVVTPDASGTESSVVGDGEGRDDPGDGSPQV